MMNDSPLNKPELLPDVQVKEERKEKRQFTFAEKILLPTACLIAVLCDRLLITPLFGDSAYVTRFAGAFWLCYLVIFYIFYWKKISRSLALWFVAGCAAALCVWNFFYAHDNKNVEFALLTYLVVPSVLMAHTQFAAGEYKLKEAGKIALAWLTGWTIKPFSAIPVFFGAIGTLFSGHGKSVAKKAILGAGITLPLLFVLIPLLSGADKMFGYHLGRLTGRWDFGSLVGHTIVIFLAFAFFYSFLWNAGFGSKEKDIPQPSARIDPVVCCIVLSSITLLYVSFCAVQFTYLFAGAGLPDGMTYSEYAREGFAQTVAVCAINMLIFGIFLRYGAKSKVVTAFLAGLPVLTGVMLVSGAVRLWLYIDAYGLTWLRILSAWFVIYLAVVAAICGLRMVKEKIPAITLCALILLGWFVVLGYANPDAMIERHNQIHHETAQI